MRMKSKVHMMLHGKGGVGKSFISCMLAQYLMSHGGSPLCIDSDPMTGTLKSYEGLHVTKLDVLEGRKVKRGKFDLLFDLIHGSDKGKDVVIDVGTSTYLPFWDYTISSDVAALLDGIGREMIVHTVVTGGHGREDALKGAMDLVRQVPASVRVVVWLNPYWGPVERDGRKFEEFEEYETVRNRVESAIIKIPEYSPLFQQDLAHMLNMRLTFDEALISGRFHLLNLQRLAMIRRELFGLMDVTPALWPTTAKRKAREVAMGDDPRIKAILKDIQDTCNMKIAADDPMVAAVAMNDRILQRYETGMEKTFQKYSSRIEGIDEKVIRASKIVGSAVLKTGVEEAYKAGDEIMEDITQRTDELFTKWMGKTEELFEKSMTEFKRIHKEIRFERWICFLAVVLSLVCALLAFWMTR